MSLLTRIIDVVRPTLVKSTPKISPNNPTFIKMFGLSDGDEIRDPYSQLPIIYAAIRAVAKVISQTPVKFLRGKDEVGELDPVVRLFAKPNPRQTEYEFKESLGVNLQVKGNAYIVLDDARQKNGLPVTIYGWPARYFTPKYSDSSGEWMGWDCKRGKVTTFLKPEQVVHVSNYNLADELLGMAPLDVLKMTYKTQWDALVYNKKFFENDGTPPIIYKAANPLPDQYRDAFKKDVIERRRGKAHAHEAQLIEGMDVTTLGFTQKDIQFLDLIKHAEEEVLMVFGVSKTQVSKYEDVNYATALSQDKMFISNTCIPMMRQIESEINGQWLDALGYTFRFDERASEAMSYLSAEEAGKIVNLSNAGLITVNEAREMLGKDPVPWGDEEPDGGGEIPPQLQPFVGQEPKKRPEPVIDEPETKSVSKGMPVELREALGKARRTNLWTRLNNSIKPVEQKCAKAVRKYFFDVERKLLGTMSSKGLADAVVKVVDPDIDNAFDDGRLESIMRTYLNQSIGIGASSLGVPDVNIDNPNVAQYLGDRVQYMRGVNDNAKERLKAKLHDALEQALADKLTEAEKVELVRKLLNEGFSELKSHARSIARTEVHSAFSEGRWEAAEELGIDEIEWVSSRDPFVRDSHAALDGKRVPLGATFANGCKYPLDPAGGAAEICNCRCVFSTHFST